MGNDGRHGEVAWQMLLQTGQHAVMAFHNGNDGMGVEQVFHRKKPRSGGCCPGFSCYRLHRLAPSATTIR
jgi:hypothetical protein